MQKMEGGPGDRHKKKQCACIKMVVRCGTNPEVSDRSLTTFPFGKACF